MKNIDNVIIWAQNKGLIKPENAQNQLAKVLEELGETASAWIKKDGDEVVDGVGDVFITLIILSHPAFYQSTKAGVGNHYPEAKGVGAEAKSTAREANMYIPHLH